MITKNEITLLRGLTKKEPAASKLEASDSILLYAKWFVLEVPKELFDPAFDDWEEAHEAAINWRAAMPQGEGDYGQASRWTNPDDGLALVKLIADCGVAIIHPALFEVAMKQLPEPEFRVFPGDKPFVAILSERKLVGGVTQVKL
jgi:hypothetical protein